MATAILWVAKIVATAVAAIGSYGVTSVAIANFIYANAVRFVITAALTAGAQMYSRAQAKKAMRGLNANLDNSRGLAVRESAGTRKILYGQMKIGGNLQFMGTSGTTNEYLHLVVAHAGHECDSFVKYYLGEEEITIDGSGNATAPAKYVGHVTIKTHLGTAAQTNDTDLTTACPTWTTNHRLRGICYSYWRLKHNPDVFTNGLPNISVLLKGKKIYDPRTTTTVWSDNSALVWRDYMLDTALGFGAAAGEMNDTAVITAANICDEAVNLNPSGTEKRYTANGIIDTAGEHGGIINEILSSMCAISPYAGGTFNLKAGAHTSSVLTLGENDLRGTISVSCGDSLAESFNGVKGQYVSSLNNYQTSDFPPVVNSTYTTEDGGARQWKDLNLPFTNSSGMAQRLAKIDLERSRQDITVVFPCKLTALNVTAGDVVAVTMARYGWTAKLFEVVSWGFAVSEGEGVPTLGIDLVLRETASGVWDWALGEETVVDLAPNIALYDYTTVATPSAPTCTTSNFTQADGSILPRMKVAWTAPSDSQITAGGHAEIEFKKAADSAWIPWSSPRADAAEEYITEVQPGISYTVRMRYVNVRGVRGSYSSTTTYTPTISTGDRSALVINPDFTLGSGVGWTIPFGTEWEISSALGELSWGAKPLINAANTLYNVMFPVRSGERYVVRAHIKGSACYGRIVFFDAASAEVGYAWTPFAGASWSWQEGWGTAPSTAISARAEIVSTVTTDRADFLKVTMIPVGQAYNDPAVTVPPIEYSTSGGYVTLTNPDGAATIKYELNGGATTTYTVPIAYTAGDNLISWAERGGYTPAHDSKLNLL